MTLFGIIRHGQTAWNVAERIQGRTDTPLNEAGTRQAEQYADALAGMGFERIISSHLARTRKTAWIINHRLGLPVEADARLAAQNWGRWTGRTMSQIAAEEPAELKVQEDAGWDFRPPEGESRRRALARILESLEHAAEKYAGQHILVVTHVDMMDCLARHLLGQYFEPGEEAPLVPDHMMELSWEREGPRIIDLNRSVLD